MLISMCVQFPCPLGHALLAKGDTQGVGVIFATNPTSFLLQRETKTKNPKRMFGV